MDIAWPITAAMSGELSILFFARSVGSACFADDGDENSVPQASALSARQTPAKLAALVLDSCRRQIALARRSAFCRMRSWRHRLPRTAIYFSTVLRPGQ